LQALRIAGAAADDRQKKKKTGDIRAISRVLLLLLLPLL
jgi:hypothetical protein